MSMLDTPDPEAAAAFYGAVFGWTTEVLDFGDGRLVMFRLPGYVGGEPGAARLARGRRRDAPRRTTARRPGSPDFWVDGADEAAVGAYASAARSSRRPFDGPAGRTVVLADPAGAPFSVTTSPVPAPD